MIQQSIARRYAKGLFAVGSKDAKYRDYLDQMTEIVALLKKEPKIDKALTLPLFEMEKRKDLLADVLRVLGVSAPVTALLGLLLEKNRVNYLPLIRDAYNEMVDDKEKVVRGVGYTAYPLSESTQARLEESLGARLSKKVHLHMEEDKDLIGGIKVIIGGMRIDGSVKRQLELLNESMMKE